MSGPASRLPPWHDGLEAVTVAIEVGSDRSHEVSWSAGALEFAAHADPEADRALAALGGRRCACIDIHEAWHAQFEHPLVLAIGRRHGGDAVMLRRTAVARLDIEAVQRSRRDAVARVRLGLARMLEASADLVDRLQAAVLAEAERRWDDPGFRAAHEPRLHAALVGRAVPPLKRVKRLPEDHTRLRMLPPGQPPVVSADGLVTALSITWLTNAWARGLAVADGEFVARVTAVGSGGKLFDVQGVDGKDWRVGRA